MSENALTLIKDALASNVNPETLRELLAVKKDWEADEARKAYSIAICEFQRRAPIVEKGDDAHGKKYARMDRIWRAIRPIISDLGLSITFQVCELKDNGLCHVEGQIRHKQGHCERIARDIPLPELIKGQNVAQQMGSASTYAQRYATCSALGLVTGDDDDDGHKAGHVPITQEQAEQIRQLIVEAKKLPDYDERKLAAFMKVNDPVDIPAHDYNRIYMGLKAKVGK